MKHIYFKITLEAPITTAAGDKFWTSRLPADDPHEIHDLFIIFEKAANYEIVVCFELKLFVAFF